MEVVSGRARIAVTMAREHSIGLFVLPAVASVLAAGFLGVAQAGQGRGTVREEARSGGDTTVVGVGRNAFAQPLATLSRRLRREHAVGNSFFNQNWVAAPASTSARDGLGPFFQARSCSACHFKDGRGEPPAAGGDLVSMLVRLSVPGEGGEGGVVPHPVYGDQLDERAIPGVTPEGRSNVVFDTAVAGRYADGGEYRLRRARFTYDLAYGGAGDDLLTSPRVAPPVFGLGLLEAVPEGQLREFADPGDADGDGVSGRPNEVWDVAAGKRAIGRFGWKAGQPSVRQQSAGAFVGDIGITSPLFPDENHTAPQLDVMAAAAVADPALSAIALGTPGAPDIDAKVLDRVTTYLRTLAPPARRDTDDPEVVRGEVLFHGALRCVACHRDTLETGAIDDIPELGGQTVRPYTDLLLHDMGEGLADGRPEFEATGAEWRTPPLWGIGLTRAVNGHTFFLHDGRARNLEEAVLWHGGEAETSRDAFTRLDRASREAVLAFLRSL